MASGLSHQIRCPVCWNDLKDPVCLPYQKPICVVCKEEETHRGHTFKTLNDAFHCKKQKTSEALETLLSVEGTLIGLVNDQAEAILKTMGKSKTLSDHISDQFMKLRKFLDDKERELKKKLEEEENQILGIMGVNMCTMEEMLSDVGTKQVIVKSALEMKQPSQFLQWWNENGRFVNREIFLFKTDLTLQDVSVIPDTLSLGIYETYLQFFVWKEMLRYIQSVPHHHTVEDKGDQGISISPSGRSIQPKKVGKSQKNKPSSLWLKAESSFYEGKHFWELDVGKKLDWGVGVCSCESGKIVNDTVLCFNLEFGYHIQQTHNTDKRTVNITSGARKIGVYLDCEKNQVSFYNTDQMTLIDTRVLSQPSPHSLCLSAGLYLDGKNSDPLTIFWY